MGKSCNPVSLSSTQKAGRFCKNARFLKHRQQWNAHFPFQMIFYFYYFFLFGHLANLQRRDIFQSVAIVFTRVVLCAQVNIVWNPKLFPKEEAKCARRNTTSQMFFPLFQLNSTVTNCVLWEKGCDTWIMCSFKFEWYVDVLKHVKSGLCVNICRYQLLKLVDHTRN